MDDLELELLAAIRAAPHDEAPLRVYADWLLEHDEPRGLLVLKTLAPDLPADYSVRWVNEFQPAKIAAGEAWARRLGHGCTSIGNFRRGLPTSVGFNGTVEELARCAPQLAPLLIEDVSFSLPPKRGHALVRGDWRVLLHVQHELDTRAHLLRVLALPSLYELASVTHQSWTDASDGYTETIRGWPSNYAFAAAADELHYQLDEQPHRLPFVI